MAAARAMDKNLLLSESALEVSTTGTDGTGNNGGRNGTSKKNQRFIKHIAGIHVRCQQNIGITGNIRN